MSPARHLISCCSLVFGLLNLTFWCLPLLLLVLGDVLIPAERGRSQGYKDAIYRIAVRCNDWWFRRILGYRWRFPEVGLSPDRSYLVVANHQSWTDSFLLQTAIVHRGPILKVLVKEELARWPILGLIFRAYDFPRLKRRAARPADEPGRRLQDEARIRQACAVLARSPAAMLVYPEGTRFTAEKHRTHSPETGYQHLLPPRPGGFATIMDAVRAHAEAVLDVDIYYPESGKFWRFLSGSTEEPVVRLSVVPIADIHDPAEWLRCRWQVKDRWLAESARHQAAPS